MAGQAGASDSNARSFGARHPCRFFTRLRRASHLSLSGQRNMAQRKATPMQRSPGILPCDCAKRFRGWLTVHPWTGSQLTRIPASHPAGNSCTTSPLHRGPIYCASCAAKTKQVPARFGFGFGSRFGAQDARYQGPVTRGGPAQELSVGWPTRCGPVRRQSTDGLSANPGAGPRTWSTGTVRKARVWGGLLFGYFLLATQEKVTRSPGGE